MISFEQRYEQDTSEFDWYVDSAEVAEAVARLTHSEDEILHAGCGTSGLGEALYKRNRRFTTNIDKNERVIERMKKRFEEYQDMEFVAMDAVRLPQELRGAFQVVVDKALLDYLLCDPQQTKVDDYLSQVAKVVVPGGHYCLVSHGPPDQRFPLLISGLRLKSENQIQVSELPKPDVQGFTDWGYSNCFYLYVVRLESC